MWCSDRNVYNFRTDCRNGRPGQSPYAVVPLNKGPLPFFSANEPFARGDGEATVDRVVEDGVEPVVANGQKISHFEFLVG